MKKGIKVRIKKSWELGTIKNCIEENGEFFYYVKIKNKTGITLLHSSDIVVL